jgi:hypothetical protein
MNHKVGDKVRIQPREWIDAQEKNVHGHIKGPGPDAFVRDMFEYGGREAVIFIVDSRGYSLDIDNGKWYWSDWMFDPDYRPDDEPLSAIDAIIAMARDEETLYDKAGRKYFFDLDLEEIHYEEFVRLSRDGIVETNHTFTGLRRRPEKRKRDMTKEEVKAWAASKESLGWMVLFDTESLDFPRQLNFLLDIGRYQRARMLPDLSGIDESTIQGFEVEE